MTEQFKVDIMKLDEPNKNGRIYPVEVMQQALMRAKFPMYVVTTPGNNSGADLGQTVDMSRVSHEITELFVEDGYLRGNIKTLNTPAGLLTQNIAKSVGVAYRPVGVGKVSEDGIITDYEMLYVSVMPADTAA